LYHQIIYWLFKLGLKRRIWKASLSWDGHLFLDEWAGKFWHTDYWSGMVILNGPSLKLAVEVLKIHSIKCLGGEVFGEQFLVTKSVRDFLEFVLRTITEYGPAFVNAILEDFTVTETRTLKSLRRSLEIRILLRLLKPGLEVYVRSTLG